MTLKLVLCAVIMKLTVSQGHICCFFQRLR